MSQKKTQNSNGKQLPWMVLVILFAGLGAIACENDPKPGKTDDKKCANGTVGHGLYNDGLSGTATVCGEKDCIGLRD